MSARNKHRECPCCGRHAKLTRDHIPTTRGPLTSNERFQLRDLTLPLFLGKERSGNRTYCDGVVVQKAPSQEALDHSLLVGREIFGGKDH